MRHSSQDPNRVQAQTSAGCDRRRPKASAIGAVAALSLAIGSAHAQSKLDEMAGIAPASLTTLHTFPGTPITSVSTHGNILRIQTSPGAGGASHVYSEGYVLCYGGVTAFDRAITESGFAEPIASSCAGTTCTITRNTSDGALQLRQVLKKNASEERSVNVEMTVRNLRGTPVPNVILRRLADFDVDAYGTGTGDTVNWWGASELDSVYAWNAANNHAGPDSAMLMRHLKRTPGSISYASKVTAWPDVTCSPTDVANDQEARGDFAATIQYNVGTLAAGASATVKVQYQRN